MRTPAPRPLCLFLVFLAFLMLFSGSPKEPQQAGVLNVDFSLLEPRVDKARKRMKLKKNDLINLATHHRQPFFPERRNPQKSLKSDIIVDRVPFIKTGSFNLRILTKGRRVFDFKLRILGRKSELIIEEGKKNRIWP